MKRLIRIYLLAVFAFCFHNAIAAGNISTAQTPGDTIPVNKDSCRCLCDGPYYPGGNTLFVDSLIKITTLKVKPTAHGVIFVRFTITAAGDLINQYVSKSIDPVFEAALLANMPLMGKWIPYCKFTDDVGPDDCCNREPTDSNVELAFRIEL